MSSGATTMPAAKAFVRACDRSITAIKKIRNCAAESYCYDEIMLTDLAGEFETLTHDTVIVMHQIGSHGPAYSERYPPEFEMIQARLSLESITALLGARSRERIRQHDRVHGPHARTDDRKLARCVEPCRQHVALCLRSRRIAR